MGLKYDLIYYNRLVRPLAIYAQCGLNLFFFRQNNDVRWRKEKIFSFRQERISAIG